MILWPVSKWRGLIQPYCSIPTREVEGFTREHVGGFCGLWCHGENERAWRGREFQIRRFETEEIDCERK